MFLIVLDMLPMESPLNIDACEPLVNSLEALSHESFQSKQTDISEISDISKKYARQFILPLYSKS